MVYSIHNMYQEPCRSILSQQSLEIDTFLIYLLVFYIALLFCLLVCLYEGVGFLGTGAIDGCSCNVGSEV